MNEELNKILDLVRDYSKKYLSNTHINDFKPGDRIPYSGKIFDEEEVVNLVKSSLEFWLTQGHFYDEFEKKLSEFLNVKFVSYVNSGSSANLLAFMALTSPLLKDRAIKEGDEVITVACSFPTTIAPILQAKAIPVFVDVDIPTYNIKISELKSALSNKTKAVFLAHTLGNPFDIVEVKKFCKENNLWLIEDNCDSLGSRVEIDGEMKWTGTIGDIGTSSFYPAHHITTGEGGAVYTNDPLLNKIINSLRDWGRDCICKSGVDNTCNNRWSGKYVEMPLGYDHKYIYSHFGYNLKSTDLQAAIGIAQLDKLEAFIKYRIDNFNYFTNELTNAGLTKYFIFPVATKNTVPSWFAYILTCREGVDRDKIIKFLESKNIQTRMLFAGNIIKQPCFDEYRVNSTKYRVVGDLTNTDYIMNNTFLLGVYPGLDVHRINYIVKMLEEAVQ